MTNRNTNQGFHNTPSYQTSGLPFVTSSNVDGPFAIDFDFVTRWIVVQNLGGADITFGFTRNGIDGNNFYTVESNDHTPRLELRIKRLYVSGSGGGNVEVIAGLTTIPTHQMDELTGSSGLPGIG